MCVAVIVESKKRIPKDHLKAMHEANPHGGGIAWYDGDTVNYRKGMSWEEIDAIQDKLPRPFLMHFRIATRGDKIPELTHPFPIGIQAFSEDLVGVADKGVIIHNGTWTDFYKYVPHGIEFNKVSDTQIAAYMAAFDEEILREVRWSNAIMTSAGIRYRGQWSDFEGNKFSNLHWKRELGGWGQGFYNNLSRAYSHQSTTPTASRTTTPILSRKKGKTHQENRHQENGRSHYQTQFDKSGKGVNTVQSNGKTIAENRENKRRKLSCEKNPYDKAKEAYQSSLKLTNHSDDSYKGDSIDPYVPGRTRILQGGVGGWEGETLDFDNLPTLEVEDLPTIGRAPTDEYEGPSIACYDCGKEITTIPCPCSEGEGTLSALEALDDATHGTRCGCGCNQTEFTESEFLDPDWKEIDQTIRGLGIKIGGTDSDDY